MGENLENEHRVKKKGAVPERIVYGREISYA